jgi:hypothetical protein
MSLSQAWSHMRTGIWLQAEEQGDVRQDKTMAPSRCLDASSLCLHIFFQDQG